MMLFVMAWLQKLLKHMKKKPRRCEMNSFDVFFNIEDLRWTAEISAISALVEDVKKAVLQEVLPDVDFLSLNKDFVVNLCLSDDKTVHKLNLEFRNIDKPTNVLSFANIDSDDFDDMLAFDETVELGDIIVAFETMKQQADEQEISLKNHFCHLMAHGLLHILGYDHMEESDRLEMEQIEIAVLNKLGIDNPYQE
ncbi:MAG: rRNA maturation RNase YbeY [Alphaproteobacteria bacterium]|nr:rRNA maturation RNase YbeY [Alphaproteobacteria bacterium]